MTTRTFEFSAGTSNKFWSITLSGSSHTVRFGRIGTSGQTQTAEFASEAEAKKSHDKLVAEKLKKGYVEKGGDGSTAAAPIATPSAPKTKSAAPAAAAESARILPAATAAAAASASTCASSSVAPAASVPPAAKPIAPAYSGDAKVRRDIDLDYSVLSYIPGRRAAPTPMPPAQPFNLDECLSRLRTKVKVRVYGWEWDFSRAIPERMLSPQEAEFWLTAMTAIRGKDEDPDAYAKKIAQQSFTGKLPGSLNLSSRYLPAHAVLCLISLMSPDELRQALLNPQTAQGKQRWENASHELRAGFRAFVLPYLDDAAIAEWRAAVKALWDPTAWPTDFYQAPDPAFFYGALFGMHDEVRALVEQWPDDRYMGSSWDNTHYHRPQDIVFGVGSAEQVAHHFRRLKLPTNSAAYILTLLAMTGFSAIDVIARTIGNTRREDADELMEAFARIHAPEAAPHALDLVLNSKAPKAAREWLENNLDEAIVGLMPVAVGTGKLADAATEFLNSVKRRGHAVRIEAHIASVDPQVAERVRAKVLDVAEVKFAELSRDATPAWWTQALAQSPVKKSKAPTWVQPTDLPPITIGEQALSTDHIAELIGALQASTLEEPHPLVRALRGQLGERSPQSPGGLRLDNFAWKLFEGWQGEGASPKEKWAFFATGLLGGDRTVLNLAPLIRNWPGESQHQRAVLGLEVLRTIGTDTALMQINGIAQKVKFKGLKERAIQCMDAIAASRGMTRAELEDRIVPDCGLDERGERVFDFGPRQFRFVLGPELKPMIRHADGTLKPDLPKPGAKDDAAVADPTVSEWKLLKKQIADVAKIQAVRLEQAMVTGRRWSGEEFDKLLVHHPLMIHLVRRLVWASYEPSGAVSATFRITEDQTLGNAADEPFTLARDARVGVLHPLQVASQPHVLEQWGQLFGDYEIVPPFPQLGRPVYRLTPEQLAKNEVTHFKTRGKLPAQSLVFGLEKRGWIRGMPADAGFVSEHSKHFYGANLTALVNYEEGFSVGYWEGAGEQTVERVYFLAGLQAPQMWSDPKKALRLADVDPIALSEVLSDFEQLLAKAE